MTRATLAFALLCLLAMVPMAEAAMPVTSCAVTVPPHEVGILQADLQCGHHCAEDPSIPCNDYQDFPSCSSVGGDCVPDQLVLETGAKLRLAGHTFRYRFPGKGVICRHATNSTSSRACSVIGPGAIIGGQGSAIIALDMDVVARNLTIDGTHAPIITRGRLIAKDVIFGPDTWTVHATKGIRAVRIVPSFDGMVSEGDIVAHQVVREPYSGALIAGGWLRVHDLVVKDEGFLLGRDVSVSRARPATPSAPWWHLAIFADGRLRVRSSLLAASESTEPWSGGELYSGTKPRLLRSTCERSFHRPDGTQTWSICRSD